jgi:ankyrin repeat protein
MHGRTEEGTVLMYTIRYGNDHPALTHCVETLLNNGAKVDVRDEKGTSALDLAKSHLTGNRRIEVEKILLLHSDTRPVENEISLTG